MRLKAGIMKHVHRNKNGTRVDPRSNENVLLVRLSQLLGEVLSGSLRNGAVQWDGVDRNTD